MRDLRKYASIPLKQKPNRVWRTYSGGLMIDRWMGGSEPADGDTPEEWVASTVIARGDNRPADEGLSVVTLPDGDAYLKDIIDSDKEAFLGKRITAKYGDTGVLIKILDSQERLTIQVHPDKEFASTLLGSRFGKTEGWYILGGREIDGEEPYVLFGFKPGVDKKKWGELFARQDIQGMIDSLHKVPVKPGDVFIINGGVPHAIGSGCFLLEIQEPTDYTMRVEKTTPRGAKLSSMLVHQGVGEEKMLDCFHYDSYSLEETMSKWKIKPEIVTDDKNSTLRRLIGPRHTDCFSLSELTVRTTATTAPTGDFMVAIIYSGTGTLSTATGDMKVNAGDEIFIPASTGTLEWIAEEEMSILLCYPPA